MGGLLRGDGSPWSLGWTTLLYMHDAGRLSLPTAIVCGVGGQRMHVLVDTGATYSVISPAVVETLEGVTWLGESVRFVHGHDAHDGELCTIPVTFFAEGGQDFEVLAKFCVSEDWERATVLGVRFCLELLNLGFQPALAAGTVGRCYFGPVSAMRGS